MVGKGNYCRIALGMTDKQRIGMALLQYSDRLRLQPFMCGAVTVPEMEFLAAEASNILPQIPVRRENNLIIRK